MALIIKETIGDTTIKGDSNPKTWKDFKGVCEMLKEMHELGYCHGDVRNNNIVFNGISTHLIDFDLSGKVGQKYPAGYRGYSKKFPMHCAKAVGRCKNGKDT